jgi:hypothetical protein
MNWNELWINCKWIMSELWLNYKLIINQRQVNYKFMLNELDPLWVSNEWNPFMMMLVMVLANVCVHNIQPQIVFQNYMYSQVITSPFTKYETII